MAEEEQQLKKKKHKEWRKEVKKLRRKRIRQKLAEQRNKLAAEEESARLNDPNYVQWLKEQEELEILEREQEERHRQEQEELWLRRELLAAKQFREQQKKQEAITAIKETERLRIQKEFEELQEKAKKRREERQQREEQAKRDHEQMMGKIFDYIELGGDIPEELTSNVQSNPNKPICPFFTKTNACRFGIHCLRNHIRPKLSRILFIPNFFTHIKLDHGGTSHGNDINLECLEIDLNNDYKVFFEDVTEELKKFGEIVNFRTCMNTQSHLRGNVLVEYSSERDALKAFVQLQGRYYAKRQINVEFSAISSWKSAICGLFYSNKCPKGRECNFLHIFRNPGNLFNQPLIKQDKNEGATNKSTQKDTRSSSVISWNDNKDSKSKRNWRWSESPESESNSREDKHRSVSKDVTRRKREKSMETTRRSSERSHRNDRTKRRRSDDKNSSRSSRHSSRHESSRTENSNTSRNERKSSKSRSLSHKEKHRKRSKSKSPSGREKHHNNDDREKHRKRSKSKSPSGGENLHNDDDREKHRKNKRRKHKSKKSKS